MLLSMTGFGEARQQENGLGIGVEIRTINSRYFKLTVRCGDGFPALETQIETLVRDRIKRGTVQVSIRIEREASADDYSINQEVVASYRRQLQALASVDKTAAAVPLEALLQLPGAVDEHRVATRGTDDEWKTIATVVEAAMANLQKMRAEEGRAMAADLKVNCQTIIAELGKIAQRSPLVVDSYRARLEERINKALADFDVTLNPGDLIREISVYAERSDISEEIVRLRSHLEQFETIMKKEDTAGRKLEFLTQEMFRETNTIGSKSTDLDIARHVIEIKTAIERIREMIQNVE